MSREAGRDAAGSDANMEDAKAWSRLEAALERARKVTREGARDLMAWLMGDAREKAWEAEYDAQDKAWDG